MTEIRLHKGNISQRLYIYKGIIIQKVEILQR